MPLPNNSVYLITIHLVRWKKDQHTYKYLIYHNTMLNHMIMKKSWILHTETRRRVSSLYPAPKGRREAIHCIQYPNEENEYITSSTQNKSLKPPQNMPTINAWENISHDIQSNEIIMYISWNSLLDLLVRKWIMQAVSLYNHNCQNTNRKKLSKYSICINQRLVV